MSVEQAMTVRTILLKAHPCTPLRLARDQRVGILPDTPDLALSHDLAVDLSDWSARTSLGGELTGAAARAHSRSARELAARLAAELGPEWMVSFYDEVHDCATAVCWQCGGFHWREQPHAELGGLRTVHLVGEFGYWPLRFDAQNDFAPDDPVVGLGLSDALVDELYAWSRSVHDMVQASFNPTAELSAPARSKHELVTQGAGLARRLSHELGAGWTVEFDGVAH